MGQRVARVAVLVQDVRVGDLVLQAPSDAHVGFRGVEASAGGRADDLGAQSSQDVHLRGKAERCWIKRGAGGAGGGGATAKAELTFSILIFSGMTMMQR